MSRRDGSCWTMMLACAAVLIYGGLLGTGTRLTPRKNAVSVALQRGLLHGKTASQKTSHSLPVSAPGNRSVIEAPLWPVAPVFSFRSVLPLSSRPVLPSQGEITAQPLEASVFTAESPKRSTPPFPAAKKIAADLLKRGRPGARVAQLPPGQGVNLLIQADRETIRRLRLAEQSIQNKQFVQALTLLQRVLDRKKDAFYYPDPEKRDVLRSVRLAAQQMIAALPSKGRELYELKHGGTARALLEQATKTGQLSGLQEVVQRFFHTQAGYEAMYQLGLLYLDQEQPLAAALCFSRLQEARHPDDEREPRLTLFAALAWYRAGLKSRAEKLLSDFLRRKGHREIIIAGKPLPRFTEEADALAWFDRQVGSDGGAAAGHSGWLVFRGNAARNGLYTLPETADRIQWRVSTITDPLEPSLAPSERLASENIKTLQKVTAALKTTHQQQKSPALPCLHPLLLNDKLFVRTTDGLRALSLQEGSWLWKGPPDIFLERLLSSEGQTPVPTPATLLAAVLQQRYWNDLTWGTLSSDGRCVYSIEETGFARVLYDPRTRQRLVPADYNRLLACDRTTGRILWEAGGPENTLKPAPLAGTWFLGVPLPVGQQLYCLAEVRGEIRLLVLEPHDDGTGPRGKHWVEVVWSQPLVGAPLRISQDDQRRIASALISYADGILLCQTGTGYVVAVDLTSRTLLWAYRHVRVPPRPPRPFPRPVPSPRLNSTWEDESITVTEGKVLLTPAGSNELICLRLLDGTVLWKAKREEGRYLVGVLDGTVFVAGDTSVRALKLKDGKAAWKKPATLPALSGRGFVAVGKAGGRLFLPAGRAGVAVVDAASGELLGTQPLPGQRIPGNLMLWNGTLISQEPDGLTAFPLPQPVRQTTATTK